MLDQGDTPFTYLRFGLTRKKEFLRDVRRAYDGIVLMGNILLYQYKSTPMVIYECQRPFFVDPMSYLFGQPYEDFKQRVKPGPRFKPSFEKLMKGHGLDPRDFLPYDYRRLLRTLTSSDAKVERFTENSLGFQWANVWNAVQEASEYLSEERRRELVENDYRPRFLIPPYFLYTPIRGGGASITNDLNSRILQYCWNNREKWGDIFPAVLIRKESLENDFIDAVVQAVRRFDFPGYCIWVEDFDERFATCEQISGLIRLTQALSEGEREVVMLYGGFFSLLLKYFGATCVCHGLAYGEARTLAAAAQQGSGPAPVRYYVLELHRFLTLDDALVVLRARPDLICSCRICQRVIGNDPERVTHFSNEEALAEMHFLYNRLQERRMIATATLEQAIQSLQWTLTLNDDIADITKRFKVRGGYEERPIVDPAYIQSWATALQEARR
jgi:hypothetical protein